MENTKKLNAKIFFERLFFDAYVAKILESVFRGEERKREKFLMHNFYTKI